MEYDVHELARRVYKLRDKCMEKKKIYDDARAEFETEENKLLDIMEANDIPGVAVQEGSVTYHFRDSFRVPKETEKLHKFLEWLKEDGMYDALVTVNSNSLQSYIKNKREILGEEWNPPGVDAPSKRRVSRLNTNKRL